MTVVASAPGKVVLSGEYAVLLGAPAICAAVDRRAVVLLQPSKDGVCHVHTPGFSGEDRFRVLDAVTSGDRPNLDIELDTSVFAKQGNKIGIGSSAALTVALTAALAETDDVLDEAMASHGRLQDGAGSGVDIATAVHGGLIRYCQSPRSVHAIDWPQGLVFRVIWTGVSASTSAQLHKMFAKPARSSQTFFTEAASMIADAWSSGNTDTILAGYRFYLLALREFSVDHDLGIFDAGHDQLTGAAMADGLVYKPAGAGGGDIGVLFGRSDDEVDEFVDRHRDLVHAVVPCRLDPDGVRVEQA